MKDRPRRWPVFLFLLLHVSLTPIARADSRTGADYVDSLVRDALAQGLDREPVWHNLLHYKPYFGGVHSLIDDPRFFLSPRGKFEPRAELEATIRAFFAPPSTNVSSHAMCRFVARFHWLDEKLAINRDQLPVPACDTYRQVVDHLKPSGVTLIFPSAFMNGPASMFGHTLLLFESGSQNRLLARAVSYAAVTTETIGPFFAFAGMFGLYPGYFAYQPYYEKVSQYSDMGHRDVWEYELNMTPAEIERMMQHAFELQEIASRYFFFDENCSYNLYFLLDVARPSLKLSDDPSLFVIPIDTVKRMDHAGIIRAVNYRPSPASRMRVMSATLGDDLTKSAVNVAKGSVPVSNLVATVADKDQRIIALDLAAEYTKYLYAERRLPKDEYSKRLLEILRERSPLGKQEQDVAIETPARPDLGHGALRTGVSGGSADGDAYVGLHYRQAYHALTDHDDGFTPGAQIQFLNTDVRFNLEEDRLELRRFDIVDVFSIAPRDALFQPASWKFRAGLDQSGLEENDVAWNVNTGGGLATRAGRTGLAWFMVEADAQASDEYHADYGIGLGPALGLMGYATRNWKHVLQGKASYVGLGDDFWKSSLSWSQDYRLERDVSLGARIDHQWADTEETTTLEFRVNLYF